MNHQEKDYYPWCSACDLFLVNKKSSLVSHSKTLKHRKNLESFQKKRSLQDKLSIYVNDPVRNLASEFELRICLLMAQKNLPFSVGHEFIQIVKEMFPSNPIFNRASLGKTKAANILREGMSHSQITFLVVCLTNY